MIMTQHIIIIPARYASSRFPGKMLAKIQGKSLLQWTYENACQSRLTDRIVIATDDDRIEKEAKTFAEEVIRTPVDCENGTHRVFLAAQQLPTVNEETIIINVQGDEPLICPKTFDSLCITLEKDPSIFMATLASPFLSTEEAHHPSNVKCVLDQKQNALYFSRSFIPYSSSIEHLYHHIGVYAFRYKNLRIYESLKSTPLQKTEDLEQLKVLEHGYKIKVIIENKPAFGVDHPEDLEKLKELL